VNPAERAQIGKTRLAVTRLGLGTAPLGGLFEAVDEARAYAVGERAFNAGIRSFDTAPLYGYGTAERRVGHILRQHPRRDVVLASKVGRLLRAGAPPDETQYYHGEPFYKDTPPLNPVFDFSYDGVMRSLEESLDRLGLDRIDMLHIHDPDAHFEEALAGAYRALDRLRSEGTIGAVGAGMNQAEMLVRFAHDANFDCFLLAGRYTLLDQVGLVELLPLCATKNISVVIGGVYNSGILANPHPGATYNYIPADAAVLRKAQRLEAVCARHEVPLKAAALQFPLGHPAVASVLIGCRSVAEIDENLRMFRHDIPRALWDELRTEHLIPEDAPVPGEQPKQ